MLLYNYPNTHSHGPGGYPRVRTPEESTLDPPDRFNIFQLKNDILDTVLGLQIGLNTTTTKDSHNSPS